MLSARAALRGVAGFLAGLVLWFGFARPYERTVAFGAQALANVFESPNVTRLEPGKGEVRLERRDFPPGSPRPGLPVTDIHFNFVLLTALFALDPRPLRGPHVVGFLAACGILWLVHIVALVFQVQSVYVTSLGPWSLARYGPVARNFWAGGWHFYQIAARFAAPFVLWWFFGRREDQKKPREKPREKPRRGKGKKKG